ncbi:hypothetical protein BH20ACT15_BH20ACT15_15940 [soil metagenome]
MSKPTLPSLAIPESEKRNYTEADVHSKLFEPDMAALGFPSESRSEIDESIFDLFEIGQSRAEVLRFYDTVGRVETPNESAEELAEPEAQAATE